MTAVSNVLINGAGPAGLSAAIALAQRGVAVDVAEIAPDRQVLGSELHLGSANLRALATLGVADKVVERGVVISDVRMRSADDSLMATIPVQSVAPDLPASVGISRSALHDVLYDGASAAGATIHHGVSVARITPREDGVDVTLTGGEPTQYQLVIGADGVQSRVRALAFADAPGPQYVGQCVWRARVPRGGESGMDVWFGAACNVGIITVSDDTAYLFCLVNEPTPPRLEPQRFPELLRRQLEPFDQGLVAWTRDRLGGPDDIHFSPMAWLVVPPPWHRGRVVLIGDAAHATTPHIGYGAGLAIEDGVVLGEEIGREEELQRALSQFVDRRFERCRMVVEGGVQISRWQQSGGQAMAQGQLTNEIWGALAKPI